MSLLVAVCVAPFFVWYEVLFMFGYRKELHEELRVIITREIKIYRDGLEGGSISDTVVLADSTAYEVMDA